MPIIYKFLFNAIYTCPYFICSANWDSQKVFLTNRISSPICIIEVFKMFLSGGNRSLHHTISVSRKILQETSLHHFNSNHLLENARQDILRHNQDKIPSVVQLSLYLLLVARRMSYFQVKALSCFF